ncbi:MAG: ADP-ribosylglycohydrolase family protein [Firmicutes bacterium]|nr:ADP-ribosylglycohydrolase family protein [Bacillota bacterium]
MLGAIIGDIVGSVYEWHNIKTKDFPFFQDQCFFTDDTVMTVAVAEAIMNGGQPDDYIDAMKKYGRLYPDAGYGGRFVLWLFGEDRKPYHSWGNGAAMRVAPCGWLIPLTQPIDDGFAAVDRLAAQSAAVTHNHPEGIKGAQATAMSIFLMRNGHKQQAADSYKAILKDTISGRYGYDLNQTLDEIRPAYIFNESCQATVPQAITAFLESTGFEDAVRNAVSLGGDSDTLTAITGSIAEAAYGIPDRIKEQALTYLDQPLKAVYERWLEFIASQINQANI